jgi:integrase
VASQRPASPIWWHPSGQWCRKHRQKFYYFGSGSHDDALRRYVAEWPAILDGRPRGRPATVTPGRLTLVELVNTFLDAKQGLVRSGELTAEHWSHYHRMGGRVIGALGRDRDFATLQPADFGQLRARLAADLAPPTLAHYIALVRAMCNFGADLLDVRVRYGDQFKPPAQRVIREYRRTRPPKLLAAADLRKLIAKADPVLKACALLALNAGFGATDCSDLRDGDLAGRPGWVVMPRKKTGTTRRCPMWKETQAAVKAARAVRPEAADPAHADRVFLSPRGRLCRRYVAAEAGRRGERGDTIGVAWRELCVRLKVKGPHGFYALRHVHRTISDEARDPVAADIVMGHADGSMAAAYREKVDDKRLVALVNRVRRWLWPDR